MEARKMESIALTLAVVVMAAFWAGASGQSCTNALVSMSPCLNYIQGNSSTPSSSCCSALASVVSSQPQCLCQVLNGGASSLGITVNQTQALALPSACKVQTPPVSQCKGGTAPPPSGSPAGTPPPESPSGGESKTVPTTDNGTSDGTSAKLTLPLLFFLLFIASSISNFTI